MSRTFRSALALLVTWSRAGVRAQSFFEAVKPLVDHCFYVDRAYLGDNLPGVNPVLNVENIYDCQKLCQVNASCHYMTYVHRDKHCWLSGAAAVYDNKGEGGSTTGPKFCPSIPSGCTELPGPNFPGWTPDESEAAWPSHRVPQKMECWPRNSTDGWYNTCPLISTLEDSATGWPAACQGLYQKHLKFGQDCRTECLKQTYCSVYVIMNDSAEGCYLGEGADCFSQRSDFPGAIRAQRVMHGEVRVLKNISGQQLFGLQRVFDQNYFVDQHEQASKACRNTCYSNIECEYWQYSRMYGCYVENPHLTKNTYVEDTYSAGVVPYPITKNNWRGSADGYSFIAGEYIQHVCPGKAGVPLAFSGSYIPTDLQYPSPEDYAKNMVKQLKKKFPRVQGAPPKYSVLDEVHAELPLATAASRSRLGPGGLVLLAAGLTTALAVPFLRRAASRGQVSYRAQGSVEFEYPEAAEDRLVEGQASDV